VKRLVGSPRAAADLEAIREHIAYDSELYADRTVSQLGAAPSRLIQFPELGRVVPELGQPDLRELIAAPIVSSTGCGGSSSRFHGRRRCTHGSRSAAVTRERSNSHEAPLRQPLDCSPPAATSGRGFSLFSGPRAVFASLGGAASAGPCTQPLPSGIALDALWDLAGTCRLRVPKAHSCVVPVPP